MIRTRTSVDFCLQVDYMNIVMTNRIHFCDDDNSSLCNKGIHHLRDTPLVQPPQHVQLGPKEAPLVLITHMDKLSSILTSCEFVKDSALNSMSASV